MQVTVVGRIIRKTNEKLYFRGFRKKMKINYRLTYCTYLIPITVFYLENFKTYIYFFKNVMSEHFGKNLYI